jgi:ubiquitin-protein ligase E3 A
MKNEETRCLWFNPSAAEDLDREYTLIGILFGLAIYNSIILDIQFPPVLYRKLMGKIGTFEDLETTHPVDFTILKKLFIWKKFLLFRQYIKV